MECILRSICAVFPVSLAATPPKAAHFGPQQLAMCCFYTGLKPLPDVVLQTLHVDFCDEVSQDSYDYFLKMLVFHISL